MKIICFIDSLGSGGAQRQMVELAVKLKQNNHDVIFMVYHDINFFKPILDKSVIPVLLVNGSNHIKRMFKCRKAIRGLKPDAVLSFLQTPNFIATISSFPFKRWKIVVGERSADYGILKSFNRIFLRLLHLRADHVVANSECNINIIKKANPLLKTNKCHVIYNILDEKFWVPDHLYTTFKGCKFNLIVAASHQENKNLNGVINAVNLLNKYEKGKLVINWYGDQHNGKSYFQGINLIKKYNLESNFNFFPATKNILEKYQHADGIGLFSFREGLPNTVCEGMMLGKTVIASDISDTKKLIDNDLVFDPKNTQDIANKLSLLLCFSKIELNEIGSLNRVKALKLFNSEYILNRYINLLKKV